MFGFITASDQNLSEEEHARYQQVYCGVCRSLHERSGQLSRLTLNNDLTFVGLLLMSLYEPKELCGEMRCPMHPIKKRSYTSNKYLDYAADMTILMAYHSMLDNWNDDHSYSSRAAASILKSSYTRVGKQYDRQVQACEQGLQKISELEKVQEQSDTFSGADEIAHEFGLIMAEIMVYQPDMWSDQLRTFGYELGRFIYLMDAVYDLEQDQKEGSYNPFASRDLSKEEMRMLLERYMGRAVDVFERLPFVQDVQILRSVLYAGVWNRLNAQEQACQMDASESETLQIKELTSE